MSGTSSSIMAGIRESVLGGRSKYLSRGKLFAGGGVVTLRPKKTPPRDWPGHIFVVSEDADAISAVLYELRDALAGVMDLDLRDVLYPTVGTAARDAVDRGEERGAIVHAMLAAAEKVLHTPHRMYFAYGSNMDAEQMAFRCPDATAVGRAALDGWQFFMDQRGYATVGRVAGKSTEGVLWRISIADELALDRYEGVASGCYTRRTVRVHMSSGCMKALVYVSLYTPWCMQTFRGDYMERIRDAALELGLSDAMQMRLASVVVTD